MKVVLFCGGQGMRLRDFSESIPKPMVPIGNRPILWHLMKYYAHFGHKEFILCLGWKGDVIKDYFLNYDECVSNNFVLRTGGRVDLLGSDIHDWSITFVDTGQKSCIGERLMAVEPYLEDDEVFMANYSDGLTDLRLPDLVDYFYRRDSIATCLGVRPNQSFHLIETDGDGLVTDLTPVADADLWMNGGFFVMRREIFGYMREGEELVLAPFQRLMAIKKLSILQYAGFWSCMDTYKEKQQLDETHALGKAPWEVWRSAPSRDEALAQRP
ncbi:MAG: sugar phosphate nucleotidyltransferase [Thermoguttaceae bacterium]